MRSIGLAAIWIAAGSSCSSPAPLEPLDIPDGCNPLAADWDCLLPYPSDVFRVPDSGLPSGYRLVHPAAGLPQTDDGDSVDFGVLHPADGFSHLSQILAVFPAGVDGTSLSGIDDDWNQTLLGESTTILLDAESGQPVLHMAELDPRANSDARRALVIRPAARLANEHRYIVAIQRIQDREGDPVAPPEGFRRLRDRETAQDPALADLAERFETEVFEPLVSFGVERDELVLAWDFTTESQDIVTRDMLASRDIAANWGTPDLEILYVEEDAPEPELFRRIEGRMEVPLVVDDDQPGAELARDAAGIVVQNGTAWVEFTAVIPQSVADAEVPARVVQYGHGFFGRRQEIDTARVRDFAQRTGVITIAVDWWGMSDPDQVFVLADLVDEPSLVMRFTDRLHQAMVNQIVLGEALDTLAGEDSFAVNGQTLMDPSAHYFYGVSLGHILGGTFTALSPRIDRAALSVGGAGLAMTMFRSVPFREFLEHIEDQFPDWLDQQKFAALGQTSFDRIDPITYAPALVSQTYPGSPASRRVLMQDGLGDTSVPNLATHAHARTLGIPLLRPTVRALPGFETVDPPHAGSALVEYDFGLPAPLPGSEATPADRPTSVHGDVPASVESIERINAFFQPDGDIVQTCDGACDPD